VSFFLFASAYWALLPLVTRSQIAAGAELYGYLLGAIGGAAVATALALPWLKAKLGPNRQVAAGTLGTALAMVLFGLARELASCRALAIFVTAMFGSLTAARSGDKSPQCWGCPPLTFWQLSAP
jgi:Transmembrane secretion effector